MEKNDKEKLLIDDIRSLFEQIKEEEKGRYQPGTGQGGLKMMKQL